MTLTALWRFRRPETPWDWVALGGLWFALFLAYPGVILATEESSWDSLYYRSKNWLRHRWDVIRGDINFRRKRRWEAAAEAAVTKIHTVNKPNYLWVDSEPEGFPDYCYAAVYDGIDPVVGSPAFVIEKATMTVHEVSAGYQRASTVRPSPTGAASEYRQ